METLSLTRNGKAATEFGHDGSRLWLSRLCGIPVGGADQDTGSLQTRGSALLRIDDRRYEGKALFFESLAQSKDELLCHWQIGETEVSLTTKWIGCAQTGMVRRQDTLTNNGKSAKTVSRCLTRVTLPPADYEAYAQTSCWCRENQGAWQTVRTGLTLNHASGQTTQGNTPYLALRRIDSRAGLVAHVLPRGNWTIQVTPVNNFTGPTFLVLELGLADTNLAVTLKAGEIMVLPEILFQCLPEGKPEEAAPILHHYLLNRWGKRVKPQAPVVYNTWFDQFEKLEVARLRRQATAAKAMGCEIFVVDAGWYGVGDGDWPLQVGDWREKRRDAFRNRMRAFAEGIREAGMGFGLWMEPERCMAGTPVTREHPEWLVAVDERGTLRFDLTQSAAYDWMLSEMQRLVKTYELAWMKIDSNLAFDTDASGAELHAYYEAWFQLLDELREACPATFFEGCSSGALRGDLAMHEHVDGHFLSDSVNPVDVLRISQGAWLRLPPGRLTRWTVIRSAPGIIPRYGATVDASPPPVIVPGGGLWEPAEIADLHFALLAGMPGMFGLGGDLAGLPDTDRETVRKAVEFYKRHRLLLNNAVAHLLTPPIPIDQREGWMAVQMQTPGNPESLVFVYRLGRAPGKPPGLRLRGLRDRTRYQIRHGFDGTAATPDRLGSALMRDGLPLSGIETLSTAGNGAAVFHVKPVVGNND